MYVILVHNDNTLSAPKKERIMQRSKLVDELWILSHPMYNGFDMTDCTVVMEYILPISKKYKTEFLVKSKDMYEDHLKYTLPLDTELTAEHGEIELQLSFILVDLDENGKPIQRVRKVDAITIQVIPITAWSDIIPDSALSALDQRIIKLDAQMKGLNDYAEMVENSKVDNLVYNKKEETLQLSSNGIGVGDKISVKDILDDGIPVVSLHSNSNNDSDNEDNSDCNCGCDDDEFPVVLF